MFLRSTEQHWLHQSPVVVFCVLDCADGHLCTHSQPLKRREIHRNLSTFVAVIMDMFFRRHFRRKLNPCRCRRPSVAVPASKARRRSSVGLASVGLAQRRRSSLGLQGPGPLLGHHRRPSTPQVSGGQMLRKQHMGRRRSSTTTTTTCLSPRFSVRRRRAAKLRTIDTHLLGPSMLLASLVQMSEEKDSIQPVDEAETEEGGGVDDNESSSASDFESVGDTSSDSEDRPDTCPAEPTEDTSWRNWDLLQGLEATEGIHPRPLIRAPRCLRRNSSHLLPADAVYHTRTSYGLYGRYRRSSQARLPSHSPNSSGSLQGKTGQTAGPRSSVSSRRGSTALYRNCSACWRLAGRRESLSHLQCTYYDPRVETWSGFLSYVNSCVYPSYSQSLTIPIICACICALKNHNFCKD